MNTTRRLLTMFVITFVMASSVHAYFVDNWSHEKLLKEADIVVVGYPVESANTTDTILHKDAQRGPDLDLGGVNTKFKVQSVLKGKPGAEITLLHYRITVNREGPLLDGPPRIVVFKSGKDHPKQDYFLYLKKRDDGRYEPVTGYYEADRSVFKLVTPEWNQ